MTLRAACHVLLAVAGTTLTMASTLVRADTHPGNENVGLDLPPQDLPATAQRIALACDFTLLCRCAVFTCATSSSIEGDYTVPDALQPIPYGTDSSLQVAQSPAVYLNGGSEATIGDARSEQSYESPIASLSQGNTGGQTRVADDAASGDATASQDPATLNTGADRPQDDSKSAVADLKELMLEEIVVTAQKREQRLLDVPLPVTAIDADSLTQMGENRLQDYFASVPGLSVFPGSQGSSNLAIRGLTTAGDNSNPTVAVTVDDVPVNPSSGLTLNSSYIPDLDPSLLSQIEVLRGPQGTLYGANSLGGLIRFVTADPSFDRFGGRIAMTGDDVVNGDGLGYDVRGAANLPVTDTLAFRVSGFTRIDPGYIDNLTTNQDGKVVGYHEGVNRENSSGAIVYALWRPSDIFSLKLGALDQQTTSDGAAEIQPTYGDLNQEHLITTGPWSVHDRLYTATVKAKLGAVDLTAVTGYGVTENLSNSDYGYGVPGTALLDSSETEKVSEEARLSSSYGSKVDWLLGGFYTHEYSPTDQVIFNPLGDTDPLTGSTIADGRLIDFHFPMSYQDTAGFANVTVHVTNAFNLQFGLRESFNRQIYNETDSGPDVSIFDGVPSTLAVLKTQRSSTNFFTYLFVPSYKFSDDVMAYARVSSGYRPGGPNADAALTGGPATYGPDTTKNYELGLKGAWLEGRLSLDASLYYIDWRNIQIQAGEQLPFLGNGGNAKSEGVELSAQARPREGLTITGWVTVDNAVLTENFPVGTTAYGAAGDRLPYSSRFSGAVTAQQNFHLSGTWGGYVGASFRYVGNRIGAFEGNETTPRTVLPGFGQINFLSGLTYGPWIFNAVVKNATDQRGYLSGYMEQVQTYTIIQPRTVAVSVTRTF